MNDITRDPIEQTEQYKQIAGELEYKIAQTIWHDLHKKGEELIYPGMPGFTEAYWWTKAKVLSEQYDIVWHDPTHYNNFGLRTLYPNDEYLAFCECDTEIWQTFEFETMTPQNRWDILQLTYHYHLQTSALNKRGSESFTYTRSELSSGKRIAMHPGYEGYAKFISLVKVTDICVTGYIAVQGKDWEFEVFPDNAYFSPTGHVAPQVEGYFCIELMETESTLTQWNIRKDEYKKLAGSHDIPAITDACNFCRKSTKPLQSIMDPDEWCSFLIIYSDLLTVLDRTDEDIIVSGLLVDARRKQAEVNPDKYKIKLCRALFYLGCLYDKKEKYYKSVALFEEEIQIESTMPELEVLYDIACAQYMLARAYNFTGRNILAEENYQLAIQNLERSEQPSSDETVFLLAGIEKETAVFYQKVEMFEQARKKYESAIQRYRTILSVNKNSHTELESAYKDLIELYEITGNQYEEEKCRRRLMLLPDEIFNIEHEAQLDEARLRYDQVWAYKKGLAAVCKNKKWGFIDAKGNEVIPLRYAAVGEFSCGLAYFAVGDTIDEWKIGFLNKSGQEVIPPTFNDVLGSGFKQTPDGPQATVKTGFGWITINTQGRNVEETQCDNIKTTLNEKIVRHGIMLYNFEAVFKFNHIFEAFRKLVEQGKCKEVEEEFEKVLNNLNPRHSNYIFLLYIYSVYCNDGVLRDMANTLADTEKSFRGNIFQYGDVEFLGVCASLYFQAELNLIAGKHKEAYKLLNECGVTYRNLSVRDDLFNEEQMQILDELADEIYSMRDNIA